MDFLIENWSLFVGLFVTLLITGLTVFAFFRLSAKTKQDLIKKWLLAIVVKAESELGSGTGKVKLSYAYDQFLNSKFGFLAAFISYEQFESMVNDALKEMNKYLDEEGNDLKKVIESKQEDIK